MPTPPSTTPKSRFGPYKDALKALSARTGTPLPSLVVSFAVLHEATAVLPLAGFFFAARGLGLGDRFVGFVRRHEEDLVDDGSTGWVGRTGREWIDEGGRWAERLGVRYGWFGYEKGVRPPRRTADSGVEKEEGGIAAGMAGDIANAVVAYAATKALLPVRIGLSMYLAPAFSRRLIDPLTRSVARVFRRTPSSPSQ